MIPRPIKPAARSDSVLDADLVCGAAMASACAVVLSMVLLLTPSSPTGGLHVQGPVSWLAGHHALPPSQIAPVACGRTLTAYSRGGGCGLGSPDYRINPSTFPFDPQCFALCGEPLHVCCGPRMAVRQVTKDRLGGAFDLWSKRPARRPTGCFAQYLGDNLPICSRCSGFGIDSFGCKR